jgi:hypothetical protein
MTKPYATLSRRRKEDGVFAQPRTRLCENSVEKSTKNSAHVTIVPIRQNALFHVQNASNGLPKAVLRPQRQDKKRTTTERHLPLEFMYEAPKVLLILCVIPRNKEAVEDNDGCVMTSSCLSA